MLAYAVGFRKNHACSLVVRASKSPRHGDEEVAMRYNLVPGLNAYVNAGLDAEQRGLIEVSPRAIASVARRAAMESYGVVGLSRRLRRALLQLLRRRARKRLILPGVEVGFIDRQVVIDLYVVVEYGTRISEVAANVGRSVEFAVERALGLPVVQVNVNVQSVRVSRGA